MKFKSFFNNPSFCYELILFSLNDLKKYHNVTFNQCNTFERIGNSWLKKTACLIQGGKYKYFILKKNTFRSESSLLNKTYFKTLVIQNAFVVLFRLLLLKESTTLPSQFFLTKGVSVKNN